MTGKTQVQIKVESILISIGKCSTCTYSDSKRWLANRLALPLSPPRRCSRQPSLFPFSLAIPLSLATLISPSWSLGMMAVSTLRLGSRLHHRRPPRNQRPSQLAGTSPHSRMEVYPGCTRRRRRGYSEDLDQRCDPRQNR